MLSAASAASAGERLRWLVASSRERGLTVSATNIGWARDVSAALSSAQLAALAPFLGPVDHVRYRCLTSRPRRPSRAVPETNRSLPALLWHRWALPLSDTPVVGHEQIRLALSVAVVIASGRVMQPQACSLLGALTTDRSVSRVLQALAARPDWAETTVMLARLADLLTDYPAPIDYHRRRRLPMGDLLPEPSWRNICRVVGVNPGAEIRLRVMRCWLYERVTGSPARLCEHAIGTSEFRAKVAGLPRTLFPELVSALDDVARRYLDDNDLAREPLRWSPPEDVAEDWLAWRHDTIDVTRLHDLIGPQGMTLGAAAARLGLSIEVVREVLNDDPAPRRTLTSAQRPVPGTVQAGARARVSRERFVELYVRQGLTLRAIAEIAHASRQVVTRLAREYDIPLRSNDARRSDEAR